MQRRANQNPSKYEAIQSSTIGELKKLILSSTADDIKANVMPYLHSDIISALVKIMSNQELQTVGEKIFNPLPNSDIGKEGYLSARVQPNSPADHPEDIFWQVMDAWSFGVGDLMLGNNPGSSTPETVRRTESTLKDILHTFGHETKMPWVVLSHIDIQDQIEHESEGSTAMHFQSIAGTDKANAVFDISANRMMAYAHKMRDRRQRTGNFFGVYLETGQGSEFTNGADEGIDMLTLESRKQGLGRAMKDVLGDQAWVLLNDVSGFIGPEVFKTKDQLIRVALEDVVIAKLHGLTGGLDVCSTFHMPITPSQLREALDEVIKARPAYLMALPTQNDPMLSYNTTPFQEHLRLRKENNLKIDSKMMAFFVGIDVLKKDGSPGTHFADPTWVFYKYLQAKIEQRQKIDSRYLDQEKLKTFEEIKKLATQDMKRVTDRGVPLAIGHGKTEFEFTPSMQKWLTDLDTKARKSILKTWTWIYKWTQFFRAPKLVTASGSRDEYLSRPKTGEILNSKSQERLSKIDVKGSDVVIVVSDGLNADAVMDHGHLKPYLKQLRKALQADGHQVYDQPIIIQNARVRVGYRIGEALFGGIKNDSRPKTIVHVIGERPGNGHNTFSAYISTSNQWSESSPMDHEKTVVVSGIADTAMKPFEAVMETRNKISERILVLGQKPTSTVNQCLSVYSH